MPPDASSNAPMRRSVAPVNEPFSWPNSSLSSRFDGIALQSTTTNGAAARALARWTAGGRVIRYRAIASPLVED